MNGVYAHSVNLHAEQHISDWEMPCAGADADDDR